MFGIKRRTKEEIDELNDFNEKVATLLAGKSQSEDLTLEEIKEINKLAKNVKILNEWRD